MTELGELELDALTEIFNVGVGMAADALYQMGGEHVPLSVPVVELTSQQAAIRHYQAQEQRPLCAIRQTYSGEFSTDAILMFPEDNSLELVRLMVGGDLPAEQLAGMAQDAMAEIGNIVLNAVISNLSSTLNLPLEGSLPTVSVLRPDGIFSQDANNNPGPVESAPLLALMIDFQLSTRGVNGYLVFLLDVPACEKLGKRLTQFVNGSLA